jgi:hypothetical protein
LEISVALKTYDIIIASYQGRGFDFC